MWSAGKRSATLSLFTEPNPIPRGQARPPKGRAPDLAQPLAMWPRVLGDEIEIDHVRIGWSSQKPLVRKGIQVGQLDSDVLAECRASNQRDIGFFRHRTGTSGSASPIARSPRTFASGVGRKSNGPCLGQRHTATGGNQLTRENLMKQAASVVVAGAFCCRLRGKNATKPALRKKSLP
jgi:hypothetical protein